MIARDTRPEILELVSGRSLRYVLDAAVGWHYRLFAQVISDEVRKRVELRRQYDLGLAVGFYDSIELGKAEGWLGTRLGELQGLIEGFELTSSNELSQIFGGEEEPDLSRIVYCARSMAEFYEQSLRWAMRLRMTSCDEILAPVVVGVGDLVHEIIVKLGNLGSFLHDELDEMDQEAAKGHDVNRRIVLDLEIPEPTELLETIAEVHKKVLLRIENQD